MTTLPSTLAMIATSITATLASGNADFNNDGVVDTSDLIIATSLVGTDCEGVCPTDLNQDGVTDQQDVLILMQMWGAVEGWVNPNTPEGSESGEEESSYARPENMDMSWQDQGPILFDGIYYDQIARSLQRQNLALELNQGSESKAWALENGVPVLPMGINGGVDWYEDGIIDEDDKEKFRNWLDANLPADYAGPLCLDLEGQWWGLLDTSNQQVMDTAIDFYIEGLEYAQSLRPNAQIGYWGVPKKSHTKVGSTTASIDRLVQAQTALFPDVYEYNAGGNDAPWIQYHIEQSLKMANGEVPVYVYTFPRYSQGNGVRHYHALEEFLHDQVQASLDAVWSDEEGNEHRISGIAFWDAYVFESMYTEGWSTMSNEERKTIWDELDSMHVSFLAGMKILVDVASGEAQVRLAQQQEAEAAHAEAVANALAIAAEEVETARQHRAEILERITTTEADFISSKNSYRAAAESYREGRKTWSTARKSLSKTTRSYRKALSAYKNAMAKAKNNYKRNKNKKAYKKAIAKAKRQFASKRTQYKRALASYKSKRNAFRAQARTYRLERSSYRSARANWNHAKGQWSIANGNWEQKVATQTALLALN